MGISMGIGRSKVLTTRLQLHLQANYNLANSTYVPCNWVPTAIMEPVMSTMDLQLGVCTHLLAMRVMSAALLLPKLPS